MKNIKDMHTVVIVGGGFAGIRAALDLDKKSNGTIKIKLISNKTHFEYYPRIYKVVTGNSPLEVCIPLSQIFENKKNIEVIHDPVTALSLSEQTVTGKSGTVYTYNDLILALGSETVYFNIEGVKEHAYGFKSINEALALKKHLHEVFDVYLSSTKEDVIAKLHIVIVGGGPSGVELAGRLTSYMKTLAQHHSVDNNFITIDIVESAPRLVAMLPEDVSRRIYNQLHQMGVNIFLNRALVKEDVDEILLKDMSVKTNTLIWTAGSRTNHFYGEIAGLQLHRNGRVLVDEYLHAEGFKNVYIAGDSAQTKYAGLAQTALYDGEYIARTIIESKNHKTLKKYKPHPVSYAVPVGDGWAAVSIGSFHLYGRLAYWLREVIDIRFFLSILPFKKAFKIFFNRSLCESCETCTRSSEA